VAAGWSIKINCQNQNQNQNQNQCNDSFVANEVCQNGQGEGRASYALLTN